MRTQSKRIVPSSALTEKMCSLFCLVYSALRHGPSIVKARDGPSVTKPSLRTPSSRCASCFQPQLRKTSYKNMRYNCQQELILPALYCMPKAIPVSHQAFALFPELAIFAYNLDLNIVRSTRRSWRIVTTKLMITWLGHTLSRYLSWIYTSLFSVHGRKGLDV